MRYVGSVHRNEHGIGRKHNVYCTGWRPSQHSLEHEVLLTDELLPFWRAGIRDILRGDMVDPKIRPDATVAGTLDIELDNGTESHTKLKSRMAEYRESTRTVVWLFPSTARLEAFREFAIPEICLLGLHGTGVWQDTEGNRVTVEKLCQSMR